MDMHDEILASYGKLAQEDMEKLEQKGQNRQSILLVG